MASHTHSHRVPQAQPLLPPANRGMALAERRNSTGTAKLRHAAITAAAFHIYRQGAPQATHPTEISFPNVLRLELGRIRVRIGL